LAAIPTLLCVSQLAINLLNWLVTEFVAARPLPRMDFRKGIPPQQRTIVVVPTMLSTTSAIDDLLEGLEIRYLANRDEHLTMYAVGLGPTTGGVVTAGAPSPSSPLAVTGTVQVFFGDPTYKQAGIIVDWSGLAPGFVGLYQLNLRVPGFHISGDALPVTLRVGSVNSPTTGPVVPTVSVN